MKKENIKGIIFDLDGTLIDTEEIYYLSWKEALKGFGAEFGTKEYLKYIGKGEYQVEEELKMKYNLKIEKGELIKVRHRNILKKNLCIRLKPFAKESLEFFSKNYRIALCSGSPRFAIDLLMEKARISSYFEIIVSRDDVKRNKPYPDIYLYTLDKINLKPKQCLAFEDTQFGLEAAKSAGLNCFALPHKFSKHQDFSKADQIMNSLKEALDLFK